MLVRDVRAHVLAVASGTLYVLGFAGFDMWPLSLVALVPLLAALADMGQIAHPCVALSPGRFAPAARGRRTERGLNLGRTLRAEPHQFLYVSPSSA